MNATEDPLPPIKKPLRLIPLNSMASNTQSPGEFVEFFGRPAYTQSGPYQIARKTGAALISLLSFREAGGQLRIVFGEPWKVKQSGDPERDLLEAGRKATSDLEDKIRESPA